MDERSHQDGSLGIDGLQCFDPTGATFTEGETYDDDAAASNTVIPFALYADSTHKTGNDSETYDDSPGAETLGVPRSLLEQTSFTRVENETTDDDQGFSSLSLPLS